MTPIPLMVSIFAPLPNWLAGILHFTRPACNDLVIGSRGLRSAVSSLDTAVNISKPGPEIGLAPTPTCDRKRTPGSGGRSEGKSKSAVGQEGPLAGEQQISKER